MLVAIKAAEKRKMMQLIHFSPRPLEDLRTPPQHPFPDMKPQGLWVSAEYETLDVPSGKFGWAYYCSKKHLDPPLQYAYSIHLHKDAKVLQIETLDALDAFAEKYAAPAMPFLSADVFGINWAEVSADYAGVVIAPYRWERCNKKHFEWYSGWDCASMCLWDSGAFNVALLRDNIWYDKETEMIEIGDTDNP